MSEQMHYLSKAGNTVEDFMPNFKPYFAALQQSRKRQRLDVKSLFLWLAHMAATETQQSKTKPKWNKEKGQLVE